MSTQGERAARLIWRHLLNGEPLDALPADLRPVTRLDGYAIQALLPTVMGDTTVVDTVASSSATATATATPLVAGWKIAATSAAGREHIGVSAPLAGRILAPYVHAQRSEVPVLGNRMLVAELEFVFEMGNTLEPRNTAYRVGEVLEAVSALRPGIELPSSRLANFVQAGEAQLIADNACAGHFVFGDASTADWRKIDLRAHSVQGRILRGGTVVLARNGLGANVHGDPREALTWLVNELSGLGEPLRAGCMVSTGTCLVPMEIAPGDTIEGDFGILGDISARLAQA